MRNILVTSLIAAAALTACGPAMHQVMQTCDTGIKFPGYVSCLKSTYERAPNAAEVVSFYAQLDGLVEEYNKGGISEAKAKARAFEIYDATVGAANNARAASSTTVINNNVGYGYGSYWD